MKKVLLNFTGFILYLLFLNTAISGCSSEVRILADDLKGMRLTERQTQGLASILFDARKYCFGQQEEKALKYINKARALIGLEPTTGEFDWENVPLESLEIND